MAYQREIFQCPNCRQQFDWVPEYADRKFACRCGHTFTMPSVPKPDEEAVYDLAAVKVKPIEMPIFVAPQPGKALAYERTGASQSENISADGTIPLRDIWLPGTMIFVGFVTTVIIYAWNQVTLSGIFEAIGHVGFQFCWEITVTLVAIFVAAWALDMSFGSPGRAIYKIAAIAIGPLGVWNLIFTVAHNPSGNAIGYMLSVCVYWWIFSYLFELDFSETLTCVMIATIFRWMSYLLWWKLF
ncbi:MAG TPA: hypothetical protein VHD56_08920 [Tepidisphaeraceae bacterium]|nr:hypothetical protein [Tepidisphaeraceae bacterium]